MMKISELSGIYVEATLPGALPGFEQKICNL